MTFPKLPYCACAWSDAHSPAATDVYNLSSIGDIHGSMTIVTSGWLLRQDDAGVTLASEWCGGDDFRGITHVPAGMVREVVMIPIPKPKKKRPPKEPVSETA